MKIIIFDLDGTIIGNGDTSCFFLDVIEKCKKAGYIIGIATSRPFTTSSKYEEKFNADFLIASSGALVRVNSHSVFQNTLDKNECQFVLSVLRRYNIAEKIIVEGNHFYCNFKECLKWDGYQNTVLFDNNDDLAVEAYKVIIPYNDKTVKIIGLAELSSFDVKHFNAHRWIKISKIGVSKFNGVTFALSLLGFSMNDAIYFGDDDDDIELLENCSIGIAMGNASEKIKNIADTVCDCVENDGVAKWLSSYFLPVC